MLTWLLSKVGLYVAGAVLAGCLVGGGYLYVAHVRAERDLAIRQRDAYKRVVKILKEDLKTDKETEDEKVRIDGLTPEQLPDEFRKLRERARGQSADPSETDD